MITLVMLGIAASFALAHCWLAAEITLVWIVIIEVMVAWFKLRSKKKV